MFYFCVHMRTSIIMLLMLVLGLSSVFAQETQPKNGAREQAEAHFILTNAIIHISGEEWINNGYIEVKNETIVSVGSGKKTAKGAIIIDLDGKHIYPSFIDLHSNYGLPVTKRSKATPIPQIKSNTKGAYAWNESIKSEKKASVTFHPNPSNAKS